MLWTETVGDGRPLVLCHGGPGLWDMFGDVARGLAADAGVAAVRWDQRGCGRSQRRGPYSLARSVADLDAVRAGRAAVNEDVRAWLPGVEARCRELAVPVLIVDGERDIRPRWAVDSLHRALPRVRRVTLPGAGHLPWVEDPAGFRRAVAGFLAATAVAAA